MGISTIRLKIPLVTDFADNTRPNVGTLEQQLVSRKDFYVKTMIHRCIGPNIHHLTAFTYLHVNNAVDAFCPVLANAPILPHFSRSNAHANRTKHKRDHQQNHNTANRFASNRLASEPSLAYHPTEIGNNSQDKGNQQDRQSEDPHIRPSK